MAAAWAANNPTRVLCDIILIRRRESRCPKVSGLLIIVNRTTLSGRWSILAITSGLLKLSVNAVPIHRFRSRTNKEERLDVELHVNY
jgi:uncharacterized paraquat-inducible protein A